jgi:hypothetical protein
MKLYFYLDSFVAGSEGITCPQEDVVFLFVGKTTEGEVVNYEPWKVTGDELLDLFLPNEKKRIGWKTST